MEQDREQGDETNRNELLSAEREFLYVRDDQGVDRWLAAMRAAWLRQDRRNGLRLRR